jgi:LuxR family maltose regulon positive regulatory protein
VLDYLIEEVLEQQSESVQTFLLQTSILDRISGPLCDAVRFGKAETVTKQDSSQQILEYLEGANLFIVPLDMSGVGTAITISLPICCGRDCIRAPTRL